MRKSVVLFFLLVVLSVFPVTVKAGMQSAPPGPKMQLIYVSIWPEYEYSVEKPGQLNVLVINRFLLDSQNIQFPIQVDVQIPATAIKPHVVAVGQTPETVSDQNVVYTASAPSNGWVDVLITATGPAIQLEYYDYNLTRNGPAREYAYQWPGTFATTTFHLDLRVPMQATNMRSNPSVSTSATDADGFKFGEMTLPDMTAGKVFTMKIDYDRDTDQPSTSFMQVKPSAPLDQPVSGQLSLPSYIPWSVAGLAVIALAVLAVWYLFSIRGARGSQRLRKRHTAADKAADDETREIYCHQCGKRAQPSDRFCRTCGAELRQVDS